MMPVPVNRMSPMTSSGAVVMQAQPGVMWPDPTCYAFMQTPQQALPHQYTAPGSLLTCPSIQPQNLPSFTEINGSKNYEAGQSVCDKPKRKLLNKRLGPTPAVLAIAKARLSSERLCSNVLRGWRHKTARRIAAKKFDGIQIMLLRNAMEIWCCSRGDVAHAKDCDEHILPQMLASKFQEQLLRLALFGWRKTDTAESTTPLQKTGGLIASFMSETSTTLSERSRSYETASYDDSMSNMERTQSIESDIASTIGSRSLDEASTISNEVESDDSTDGFGFLGEIPTWELPRVVLGLGQQRRIGIDLGGVVFCARAKRLIPRALDGVRGLTKIFGAENVFIVSKVRLHGSVHEACRMALTKPGGFLEKTSIPKENVVFVSAIGGPTGKGIVSARLGLTHFIDDRIDVLHSIYADEAGNSREFVEQCNGTLFHFKSHVSSTRMDSRPSNALFGMGTAYLAVAGWSELLASFGKDIDADQVQIRSSVFTKSVVEVHRIPIDVDEDIASRSAPRLLHGFEEIEVAAGVKIFLRGKGSPHPQAKSAEQDPLSIEVRTKTNGAGSLDVAIPKVKSLLEAVIISVVQDVGFVSA
jgi:hypothetical protein